MLIHILLWLGSSLFSLVNTAFCRAFFHVQELRGKLKEKSDEFCEVILWVFVSAEVLVGIFQTFLARQARKRMTFCRPCLGNSCWIDWVPVGPARPAESGGLR